MERHTPGPWKVATDNEGRPWVYATDEENEINRFDLVIRGGYFDGKKISVEEEEANASLIAAAPDLCAYAECEEAISNCTSDRPYKPIFKRHGYDPEIDVTPGAFLRRLRKAAIAKATAN